MPKGTSLLYFPSTKWTRAFMGIAVVQAIIILGLEGYLFATFQSVKSDIDLDHLPQEISNIVKAVSTFLALYIFGFIYDLLLVYDALRAKNTIQVIGLVLMNVGLLIYGAIQLDTISNAIVALKAIGGASMISESRLQPFIIAITVILAVATVAMGFVAWKLYGEFSWTIYKHISADLRMRRRYLNYQIYIALLKFDFFFFLGFTIQFVVIVRGRLKAEYPLTIAAIPVTVIILIMAAFFMRHEILTGMIAVFIVFFAGMAYFIFKLYRMYEPGFEAPYQPAIKELTTFAVITILLIAVTIGYMVMCCSNFNKGLKPYITKSRLRNKTEEKEGDAVPLSAPYLGGAHQGYGHGGIGMTETYGKPAVASSRPEID